MKYELYVVFVLAQAIARYRISHRRGFLFAFLVNMLDVASPAIAMTVLGVTFGSLGGWSVPETMLLVAASMASVGWGMFLTGAFQGIHFMPFVQSGEFEAAVLRPNNTVLGIFAATFRPYRAGRIVSAIALALTCIVIIGSHEPFLVVVSMYATVFGTGVIVAIRTIDTSACLFFGQKNDFTEGLPFNLSAASSFPQNLYSDRVRMVTQYVFGLGAAIYPPIAFVLGRPGPGAVISFLAGPVVMVILLAIACTVWHRSMRYFESGES